MFLIENKPINFPYIKNRRLITKLSLKSPERGPYKGLFII
jgi:hypothetical protein